MNHCVKMYEVSAIGQKRVIAVRYVSSLPGCICPNKTLLTSFDNAGRADVAHQSCRSRKRGREKRAPDYAQW